MLVDGVNIPEQCADCPFSQWNYDENDKPIRPACDQAYLYAGIDVEDGMPFSVSLRGSGMSEAKRLNFLLKKYGITAVISMSTLKKTG